MKKLKIPLKIAIAFSTSISASTYYATAQETASQDEDVIIVTANRRPQPLSQIGSSVSVLTEADLERGQQPFVLDALESLPGVSTSQNGSFGGSASISIRGAGGDNTVLLIDGVQVNDASAPGGAFNFATLDTYNISRIEVLRGPQSILYGSDAIGGVVNIITKTGGEGLGGKIFVEGGSFNTRRAGASLYGGTDKIGFNISASGLDTDGISEADENNGNTEADGLSSYTFAGKLTAQLTETFQLEALGNYTDTNGFYDAFDFVASVPFDGSMLQTNATDQFAGVVRGNLELLDGRFTNTLSAEYSEINRTLLGDFDPFLATGTRTNIDYLGVLTVNQDWTVTGGLQHEKTKSEGNSESSFDINSVFGELAFTGFENLVITAGTRYDDHQTFGGNASSRITASYTVDQTGTKILANWGQGFRAPSISQLTFAWLTFSGINEDLNPETSTGFEVGFVQPLAGDRVTVGATYFHQKVNDKITYVNFTDGYDNIDKTLSKGIEFTASANVTDTISVNANYTYTDAKDVTDGNEVPLIREPKHLISGSIQWNPIEKLSTSLLVTHNGEEQQLDGSTLAKWTRVDVRVSYELMEDLNVYGRVDNVLNTEYQYIPNYGTPDRSFFMGLRKTF
ncbi:MAG: TonB-dependent receptor [Emcibacteraceae bacterium]|nr:TonB-dependent receptor [Emcibacteraceae bacterium]MDG1726954.1 TonB-dependent receptor [Emcibacteraceae bacterium]